MTYNSTIIVYVGCLVMGLLIGIVKAMVKRQDRKTKEQQKELLKWQHELEIKASEIRRLQKRL